MKYKICKFQDGNGKEWYQVKRKVWWLFWRWARYPAGPPPILLTLIHRFDTFELAQKWADKDKQWIQSHKNCQKIKLIECVEV
jgi:hypothetical protein